ncbi:MAG: carboxylating nicotinate-nucleotide diphosphorylase [Thiotrichaceae bacterium]|nr:carboxylating nicotinate-nucleotide diphosphorylase [Thiotrichaceae bacterium]
MKKLSYLNPELILKILEDALREDIGPGDYSTLAAIDESTQGQASLIIKDNGVLAGVEVARQVFVLIDDELQVELFIEDGQLVKPGDIVLSVSGRAQSILSAERLVLNIMQRMSGVATKTHKMKSLIDGTGIRLLDTRKTTPNFRAFEKWAVVIGGGENHRFALYDMIMLKDNHIDYAGGISEAVARTKKYLAKNNLELKIEVETRTLAEVEEALNAGVDIILLDNMNLKELRKAVLLVNKKCTTEASGGINENNIKRVAATGADYISVGALTHSYNSLDMSLKAIIKK